MARVFKIQRWMAPVTVVVALGVRVFAADDAGAPGAPFTISPKTTVVTMPLRPDGTPDYAAAVNAQFSRGVTADNNAYVAFLEAIGTHKGESELLDKYLDKTFLLTGAKGAPADQPRWRVYREFLKDRKTDPVLTDGLDTHFADLNKYIWKSQDEQLSVEYLKTMDGILDKVRQALDRPKWWAPVISVGDDALLMDKLLPSLGQWKDVANVLCVRATMRFGQGDFSAFLADVRSAKRLGRMLSGDAEFIERLVGYAIEHSGDIAIAAAVDAGTLTSDQCAAIRKMESELPSRGGLLVTVDVLDRYITLELLTRIAMDKVKIQTFGDDWGNFQRTLHTIDRSAMDWDDALRQFNAEFDRICNMMISPNVTVERQRAAQVQQQLDDWEKEFAKPTDLSRKDGEERKAYSDRVSRRLMAQVVGSYGRTMEIEGRARMSDEMAMALVALADSRAKTGQWPETLVELVPEELKELPRDIYSADGKGTALLKYGMTENGPRISSVGSGGQNGMVLGGFSPKPADVLP